MANSLHTSVLHTRHAGAAAPHLVSDAPPVGGLGANLDNGGVARCVRTRRRGDITMGVIVHRGLHECMRVCRVPLALERRRAFD